MMREGSSKSRWGRRGAAHEAANASPPLPPQPPPPSPPPLPARPQPAAARPLPDLSPASAPSFPPSLIGVARQGRLAAPATARHSRSSGEGEERSRRGNVEPPPPPGKAAPPAAMDMHEKRGPRRSRRLTASGEYAFDKALWVAQSRMERAVAAQRAEDWRDSKQAMARSSAAAEAERAAVGAWAARWDPTNTHWDRKRSVAPPLRGPRRPRALGDLRSRVLEAGGQQHSAPLQHSAPSAEPAAPGLGSAWQRLSSWWNTAISGAALPEAAPAGIAGGANAAGGRAGAVGGRTSDAPLATGGRSSWQVRQQQQQQQELRHEQQRQQRVQRRARVWPASSDTEGMLAPAKRSSGTAAGGGKPAAQQPTPRASKQQMSGERPEAAREERRQRVQRLVSLLLHHNIEARTPSDPNPACSQCHVACTGS